jgi:hypothetical protein
MSLSSEWQLPRQRRQVPSINWERSVRLHGVISQKTVKFRRRGCEVEGREKEHSSLGRFPEFAFSSSVKKRVKAIKVWNF